MLKEVIRLFQNYKIILYPEFGSELAKEPLERTQKRTRDAGLRRGEAPARCAHSGRKFKIQNCQSGSSLRRARTKWTCGTRVAGLRRREAAARTTSSRSHGQHKASTTAAGRCLWHRSLPEKSPQPSGRVCDVEEQPSARGRLRAADPCGIEFAGDYLAHNWKLQARLSVMTSFLGCGLPILRDRICWRLPRLQLAAAGSPLCNDVIPRLRAFLRGIDRTATGGPQLRPAKARSSHPLVRPPQAAARTPNYNFNSSF